MNHKTEELGYDISLGLSKKIASTAHMASNGSKKSFTGPIGGVVKLDLDSSEASSDSVEFIADSSIKNTLEHDIPFCLNKKVASTAHMASNGSKKSFTGPIGVAVKLDLDSSEASSDSVEFIADSSIKNTLEHDIPFCLNKKVASTAHMASNGSKKSFTGPIGVAVKLDLDSSEASSDSVEFIADSSIKNTLEHDIPFCLNKKVASTAHMASNGSKKSFTGPIGVAVKLDLQSSNHDVIAGEKSLDYNLNSESKTMVRNDVVDTEERAKISLVIRSILFDKIETNEKTVEARIATGYFMKIKSGDLVRFLCGNRSTTRRVIGKAKYSSFLELLKKEGVNNCLPGATDLAEAVQYYQSFANYASMEKTYGAVAFRLESKVYDCSGNNVNRSDIKVDKGQRKADAFDGSHGVIKKTQKEQIVDMSNLNTKTKIAVPLKVTKDGIKFDVEFLEKERRIDINSITHNVLTNDATDNLWEDVQKFENSSSQQVMNTAIVKSEQNRKFTIEELSEDVQKFEKSSQQVMNTAIVKSEQNRKFTIEELSEDVQKFENSSSQQVMNTAIVKSEQNRKFTIEELSEDVQKFEKSSQQVMNTAIVKSEQNRKFTIEELSEDVQKFEKSSQQVMNTAIVKSEQNRKFTIEELSEDVQKFEKSSQQVMNTAIVKSEQNRKFTIEELSEDVQKFEKSSQQVMNTPIIKTEQNRKFPIEELSEDEELRLVAIKPTALAKTTKATPKSTKLKLKSRKVKLPSPKAPLQRRINWIPTSHTYEMSEALFDIVYNKETKKTNHAAFLYRKYSIGIEIDKVFPGCVIYIDKCSPTTKYWKLRAYCGHIGCRKYILTALHTNPRKFEIEVNKLETCHKGPHSRQLRRFERDQANERLKSTRPNQDRNNKINAADEEVTLAGNHQEVFSLCVVQKARTEALKKQDKCSDDIDDVEAMRTNDRNTNFISNTLSRKQFAVYLHSKRQHDVLHKLHQLRDVYGSQIFGRLDASGNIARDIEAGKLLYHAITVNLRVQQDKKTTPLPLSEQFNVSNTSADIARWIFDYVLSHASFYEDHPLLFDWMISDFSYANFHAILKAFNSISLKAYLNLAKEWISYKLINGKFPDGFFTMVTVRMCYTHLMHTFALMLKRLYGKNKNKQLPHVRIILEILGTMIKATDYSRLLQYWEQLTILLKSEYVNDHVNDAVVEINNIKEAAINLEDYDEDKLNTAAEVEILSEYDASLYKNNLFYLQFAKISDELKTYQYNEETKEKNMYYNPEFLQKFLVRFVPLIPFWTNILSYESKTTLDQSPPLTTLDVLHNQPIENYFGHYKTEMEYSVNTLGRLPVKMGRAITFSQDMMTPTIKSVKCLIPKERLNTQRPRKPYVRQNTKVTVQHDSNDEDSDIDEVNKAQGHTIQDNVIHTVQDNVIHGAAHKPAQNDSSRSKDNSVDEVNQAQGHLAQDNVIDKAEHKPVNKACHTAQCKSVIVSTIKPQTELKGAKKSIKKKPTNDENAIGFAECKESFNKKRPIKNFTYLQGKQMKKVANKRVLIESNTQNINKPKVLKNGLWQDINLYRNLDLDFILCKKNGLFLTNKSFDALNPKESIPEPLMEYLLNALPRTTKAIVSKNGIVEWEFQLETEFKIEFVTTCTKNGWVLLTVDHKEKCFGYLLSTDIADAYTSTLRSEKYTYLDFQDLSSNDYNSGIFIYKYILAYSATRTLPENEFCADSYRSDLQKKVVSESENMKDDCPICGFSDDDTPMGECTSCERWLHCRCINVAVEEIDKDENFKCPICLILKF